ncbi:MAG: peptidoglycan editing factor PgeF [Candidatus Omnitrophica bacterium]|nr:peptidoglycan editing factor PgeF [Candidatus Omnitrophota bacterium]
MLKSLNKRNSFSGLFASEIAYGFSSRSLGNMSLYHGNTESSLDNRKHFLSNLGINWRDLICAKQVHASNVKLVTEKEKGRGAFSYDAALADTDALITDRKNLPLAVFTADCHSIFLFDPKTPAVGLVHAGWRSSKEKITLKAVKLMQEKFNTLAENLLVSFGPVIRNCCYEVGSEFKNHFPQDIVERGSRLFLDLIRTNKRDLHSLGVKERNIFDPAICTSCNNEGFFSYRKEGKSCGRMMSVVMLR